MPVLFMLSMAVHATEFVIPREIRKAKWSYALSDAGELRIAVGENNFIWSSRYSYPGMADDGWLKLPGVKVVVRRGEDGCDMDYTGEHYTIHREIRQEEQRLLLNETIKNITASDLAIAHEHKITSETRIPLKKVLVGGVSSCPGNPSSPDSPTHNSTLFFRGDMNTLGVLVEDDYERLQSTLSNEDSQATISNRSFCLAPGAEYTFSFSFYPTASGDYWDFINTVRRDWKLNYELDGNILFATNPHKMLCDCLGESNQTYRDIIRDYRDNLGIKYISATNGIWMGNSQLYGVPGSISFMEAYISDEIMLERYKNAMQVAAIISPELRPFALVQTIYAGPAQMVDNQEIPFADSCIVEKDGKPMKMEMSSVEDTGKILGYVCPHYPAVGNSYFDYLKKQIAEIQKTGIKDVYFDTATFSYWSRYGRWTYDKWDGFSCDIDEKTWTIAQKKCDLAIVVAEAYQQLFDAVEKNGGKVITNGSWIVRKMIDRSSRFMNFYEGRGSVLPHERHLNQPTVLGYYPGYTYLEPWDDTSKLFANLMENLDWGILTYIYWPVAKPITAPAICRHFFPITVKNIYAGCVEGEDRIITRNSGRYSLGTSERPKVFIYEADGTEHVATSAEAKFTIVDEESWVKITVPEDGAAVIVTTESLKETLKRELGQ